MPSNSSFRFSQGEMSMKTFGLKTFPVDRPKPSLRQRLIGENALNRRVAKPLGARVNYFCGNPMVAVHVTRVCRQNLSGLEALECVRHCVNQFCHGNLIQLCCWKVQLKYVLRADPKTLGYSRDFRPPSDYLRRAPIILEGNRTHNYPTNSNALKSATQDQCTASQQFVV